MDDGMSRGRICSPGPGGVPQNAGHDGQRSAVPDRVLAAQLTNAACPCSVIENAFVLAAARRLMRPAGCSAAGHDSLAGLFPAGDRGSAGRGGRAGLLQLSPVSARSRIFPTWARRQQAVLNHRALRSQRAADQAFGLG